ncbi:MAG: methyltransferase domain-containing protein [Anaerolineae bacterium]|nr:methyltransferase domain-containing protein [Anaerolineae bacterium]
MGFDHFSLLAPFYDRVFRGKDLTQLKSLLGLPTDGRLLDAGGGTGRVAHNLHGLASQIVVTDVSNGMLSEAIQKDGLTPLQAHAELFPFADASFTRILVVDAFHHFCNQREAAVELWRVLAPGGRLVIEEPNIDTWPVKLIALAEKLALMRSHFYAPRQIKAMFEPYNAHIEIHTDQQYTVWVVVQK